MSASICPNSKYNASFFIIIKKCTSNFETKIHNVLLIKKQTKIQLIHLFIHSLIQFIFVIKQLYPVQKKKENKNKKTC